MSRIFPGAVTKSDLHDFRDSSEMPDGWNFPYAITHVQPFSHAFPLIIVPSPSLVVRLVCRVSIFEATHNSLK